MSVDRLAASDSRPADFLYLASGQRSCPLSRFQPVFLHVRHSAGDLADACSFTGPSAHNVDRLSSGVRQGRRRFPGPLSGGRSAIALPRSRSSCSPLPNCFATFWAHHCPLCRSIDGVPTSTGNSVGDQPAIGPPLRTPAGDPTLFTPVKGMYSGEMESLDRDPGIAISRELTSLNHTKQSSDT